MINFGGKVKQFLNIQSKKMLFTTTYEVFFLTIGVPSLLNPL